MSEEKKEGGNGTEEPGVRKQEGGTGREEHVGRQRERGQRKDDGMGRAVSIMGGNRREAAGWGTWQERRDKIEAGKSGEDTTEHTIS